MIYKIGTRGSKLALVQANMVKGLLEKIGCECEIKIIKTTGDIIKDRSLSQIGGKGLFIKEIERALAEEEVDIAVHSMKDMPPEYNPIFKLSAILKREEVNDVLVSRKFKDITNLPENCLIGTASPRRKAFIEYYNKNVRVELLRGNVDSRLNKLMQDEYDGIILAKAGLKRLNLYDSELADYFFDIDEDVMLPSVGQGAIGIQIRSENKDLDEIISNLNDENSYKEVFVEREVIASLGASCFTPVGIRAKLEEGQMNLKIAYFKNADSHNIIKRSWTRSSTELEDLIKIASAEMLTLIN